VLLASLLSLRAAARPAAGKPETDLEDAMTKVCVTLLAACALVAGCGDDDSPTAPTADAPLIFSAVLTAANEVPPIGNAESSARGAVQITMNVTRNAANAVTGATATFYFQATGLEAGTNIVGAHIHPGVAGVNGPVIVSTGLTATQPLAVPGGTVEFSRSGFTVEPATAQALINNPAAFYFNVHSRLNPGGAVRGQLTRIQ